MIAYHASNKKFNKFSLEYANTGSHKENFKALWFSTDREYIKQFGEIIYKVSIDTKNFLRENQYNKIDKLVHEFDSTCDDGIGILETKRGQEFADFLLSKGIDGYIFPQNDGKTIICFNPDVVTILSSIDETLTVYNGGATKEEADGLKYYALNKKYVKSIHPHAKISQYEIEPQNIFDYSNPKHVEMLLNKLPEKIVIKNNYRRHERTYSKEHFKRVLEGDKYTFGNWNLLEDKTIQKIIKDLGFDSMYLLEYSFSGKEWKNIAMFESKEKLIPCIIQCREVSGYGLGRTLEYQGIIKDKVKYKSQKDMELNWKPKRKSNLDIWNFLVYHKPNSTKIIDKDNNLDGWDIKYLPTESMNEKLEELSDDIYATQSAYDILNLFKNKPKAYRVVYDKNIRYYFIGDALKYIHSNLISAAYNQGFYYDEFDMGSKDEIVTYLGDNLETQDILMLSFFPKDFGDVKAIDDERSSDWYTNKYTYDFGTIYVHEINEFEDFDFYHIAKPLSYEKLEIPENLDENLEKLENDYGEDIYATEYEYEVVNYCKETKSCLKILYANGWYFIGSAYSLIHNDLKNTAAKNGFFGEVEFKYGNAVVNTEDHDLFTFDVNTDEENARLEDEDKFVYEYPFGLFYTKRHIEDTPLYKYLGKPLNIRTLKSIYESLNSEIERYL